MENTGRIHKSKQTERFTILPNEILRRKDMTFKAKGLLAFMLSLPADWVLYKSELHQHSKEGRDAIRSAWKELEDLGYIKSEKILSESKQFQGYNYEVFDFPISENPISDNTVSENTTLQKKEDTKTDETKTDSPLTPQGEDVDSSDMNAQIDELYNLYPTKCPARDKSTGKLGKHKQRIKQLVKKHGYDHVKKAMEFELELKVGKEYLRNFSTYLNNFPDKEDLLALMREEFMKPKPPSTGIHSQGISQRFKF